MEEKNKKSIINFVGKYMYLQAVACLTVLGLMLICKLVFFNGYTSSKSVFSHSTYTNNLIKSSVVEAVDYVESMPVFSSLFEKENEVMVSKNQSMAALSGQINAENVNACPVWGGTVILGYGAYEDGFHQGIDIGVNMGSAVVACYDGTVQECANSSEYGNYVKIEHPNGLITIYGNLLCPLVSEGQKVKMGNRIGLSGNGSKGACVHFAVMENGKFENPLNYVQIQN